MEKGHKTDGDKAWTQLLNEIRDLRADLRDVQKWRGEHMNECHPALLRTDATLEGRWAIIAGFCFGIGVALGYAAAEFIRRWMGG